MKMKMNDQTEPTSVTKKTKAKNGNEDTGEERNEKKIPIHGYPRLACPENDSQNEDENENDHEEKLTEEMGSCV